jgi:hypothetical protein
MPESYHAWFKSLSGVPRTPKEAEAVALFLQLMRKLGLS